MGTAACFIRILLVLVVTTLLLALGRDADWTAYWLSVVLVVLSAGVIIATHRGHSSLWFHRGAIVLEIILIAEWIHTLGGTTLAPSPGVEVQINGRALFLMIYVPVLVASLLDGPRGSLLAACLAIVAYLVRVGRTPVGMERELLAMVFSHFLPLLLVAGLMGYLVRVAERERLARAERDLALLQFEHTLALAAEMQEAIRPEVLADMPLARVAVREAIADRAIGGGDFCSVIRAAEEGTYALGVADVAGRTLAGLALVPLAYAAFRVAARHHTHPEESVEEIDALLGCSTEPHVFVALFVGVYEPASGRLEYCNAGQPDALVVRADGVERLRAGGPAPGAVPGSDSTRYASAECALAPGDTLVVATDGIAGDEEIVARIENVARRIADVEQLAEAVLALGDSRDDRAVLVLRRTEEAPVLPGPSGV